MAGEPAGQVPHDRLPVEVAVANGPARTGHDSGIMRRVTLFDRYVIVDWSASNRPNTGKDSIWFCSLGRDRRSHDVVDNPPTRLAARERIRSLLMDAAARQERVLVGFDFPYGYPRGFAAALGLAGVPWRATWDLLSATIQDHANNANNRFEVAATLNTRLGHHAYWGRPSQQILEWLSSLKDRVHYLTDDAGTALNEWRETERALQQCGHHPQSVWKLLGAGAVGSQTLVGIPVVADLRDDARLAPMSRVWPFEVREPLTTEGQATIVHAEVWPSILNMSALVAEPDNGGKVRDRVQVEQLAAEYCRRDEQGSLGELFARAAANVVEEEGWVLGA